MTANYQTPLALNFVWHPSDNDEVLPILDFIRNSFVKKIDRPFSRGLNIPIFYYSSKSKAETPESIPKPVAKKNITFIFTSKNTIGRPQMEAYINKIESGEAHCLVPVALDTSGLSHGGPLASLNCIRVYDWPEPQRVQLSLIHLAHEIHRQGFSSIEGHAPGKASSINLFLSHAKAGNTGVVISENIKSFIDNTNMNRFFDSTEISPGFAFHDEIEKHISNSTLIVIETDAYSSRYWCQREILCAKQNQRPIIVINSLENYEDRGFPAASNVPRIRVDVSQGLSKDEILKILSEALLETIRHNYAFKTLESFRDQGRIPKDCAITSRPPEIRQVLEWKKAGVNKACYPDPPIYPDEADWHQQLDFNAFTPLWSSLENESLKNLNVGISISDFESDGFQKHHQHPSILKLLAQEVARNLLSRSAILLYGGDLREGGFTEFILDEAMVLQDRLKNDIPPVQNHLAWPQYISDPEIVAWRAKYRHVMKTHQHSPPEDVIEGLDNTKFLPPNCAENLYVWSRSLTEMRYRSISGSDARVCAGGKLTNFKGKMPGVLEEVMIALEYEKPIYLLGGAGGVVGDITKIIMSKEQPLQLTEEWQGMHTAYYSELQEIAKAYGNNADYSEIFSMLSSVNYSDLAERSGLSKSEYLHLMTSPFVDECLHLILKGLKSISGIQP
ncbi:hypothetical protein [Marinobacterium arenosum]|uniref:hypothetical protein n=1 Tax=Marinobacterium arenosum TaxID=2862496 RepID=UPI001C98D8F8|nr:hypothetical protein [Marinobacterium arenosum]MBY4678084.1 hypothetical protein [Marinobacterium arenosum]